MNPIDIAGIGAKTAFKMMIRHALGISFCVLLLAVAEVGSPIDNKGPAQMDLFGGSRGKVPFPHRQHQQILSDCNACHAYFPQQTDSIEEMKRRGTLDSKTVMNKLCVKCHRTEKRAGKPSGPTSCSQCHVRGT